MTVVRSGNQLHINATLPDRIITSNSRCYWKLKTSASATAMVVKQCFIENRDGCGPELPLCKSFSIVGVEDTHDYHLTVYYSNNLAIYWSVTIEKGIEKFFNRIKIHLVKSKAATSPVPET